MQPATTERSYPALNSAWIFLGISLLASFIFGGLAFALQEQMGQYVGFVFMPLGFVPLILAYLLHKRDGGGGPFKGLVWGPTPWYWLLAAAGLGWGALVIGAQLALGLCGIDPEMGYYVQLQVDAAAEMGQSIPDSARGALSISGWITFGGALLFGPWLGALFGSLSSFPLLGFALRRLLVKGRIPALLILMAYSALAASIAGLIDNPNLGDAQLPLRIALFAVYGLAGIPAMLWVFLKTRSAVLPALLTASYSSALTAATPFMSDYAQWLSSANGGLIASAGSLLLGLALWVWQDPGSGKELAAAAFGNDGTPLTPEQYERVLEQRGVDSHA